MKLFKLSPSMKFLTLLLSMTALAACQPGQQDNEVEAGIGSSGLCARACLEEHMDDYLEALVLKDPSISLLAENVVFVENNQRLNIGEGSWQTMTATGSYRHYFADPSTQQVAVISTMRENDAPVIFDVRLMLEEGEIVQIESAIMRDRGGAERYEAMDGPPANFLMNIPEEQRNTREELLATTVQYFESMENNIPNRGYPFFDDECNRIEHATKTTNNDPEAYGHSTDTVFVTLSCAEQFDTGFLGFVTRVRDKRYMVIDEERQTVFGMIFLDHNGTVRNITMGDGSNFEIPSYFSASRTLMVGEAWRVRDNKLLEIEMTLTEYPYGARPAFEPDDGSWFQSANLNPDNLSIAANCDQSCLDSVTNDFLSALVSHDASSLALSQNIVYTENGQQLAIGDGLWGTATEINDYQIFLANPENAEAGFFGAITETDIPGLLSAKLTVDNGEIQSIDVTVMRYETRDARGGTMTIHGPQLESMFSPAVFEELDNELIIASSSTADYMNAFVGNNLSGERELSPWVSDEARGLYLMHSVLDIANSSAGEQDRALSGAYSLLSSHLFKFQDEEFLFKKSVSKVMPYKMPML